MYNYTLSLIAGLIAMVAVTSSYMFKKRSFYLLFQSITIVFLILSYLFIEQYFSMIGLFIALIRAFTFFMFEKKDKKAPVYLSIIFSVLTLAGYFIVNLVILKDARPLDIINLVTLIMYAFFHRIRNYDLMRYLMTMPLALSVLYNLLIEATPFVIISYSFEFAANLVAIVINKKRIK
ncbi:MAG: YgjV family protein [Clostridia bacterium]|nr:YgjV family protein [Clostridia bacterium]